LPRSGYYKWQLPLIDLVNVTEKVSDVMAANNYLPLHEAAAVSDRDDVIKRYFDLGIGYSDILRFLPLYHDMELSLRQLSRLGLQRRKSKDSFHTIVELVEQELAGSGRDLGYRSMHDRLRKIHHVVIVNKCPGNNIFYCSDINIGLRTIS
jgi:hypothetical protein